MKNSLKQKRVAEKNCHFYLTTPVGGKAKKSTEFSTKISMSMKDGLALVDSMVGMLLMKVRIFSNRLRGTNIDMAIIQR